MKFLHLNQHIKPIALSAFGLVAFLFLSFWGCSEEPLDIKLPDVPLPSTNKSPNYFHLLGAIHLQTPVSGGKRTVEDYANLAREHGLGFLIITDHDNLRYEYGLWPLRGIIKKTVQFPSVLQFGVKNYLQGIQKVNQKFKEIIIIDGVESDPFYYWDGSYFKKNLSLINPGRHILVVGLNEVRYYEKLPCIGNGCSRFTQYQGDQLYRPYQDLIDYVNQRGGLTFWAHPEAQEDMAISSIRVETLPYPEAIQATVNYTGFSILSEGYRRVGCPGGVWDRALKEYCRGTRKTPPWVIGELDDYGAKQIDSILTVCLVRQKSYQAIIEALRYGRTYVITHPRLRLDWFSIQNAPSQKPLPHLVAINGNEINCNSFPFIRFHVSSQATDPKGPSAVTVRLLRDGRLVKEFNSTLPCQVEFEDRYYQKGEKIYYRLDAVTNNMARLISNPIFVRFE